MTTTVTLCLVDSVIVVISKILGGFDILRIKDLAIIASNSDLQYLTTTKALYFDRRFCDAGKRTIFAGLLNILADKLGDILNIELTGSVVLATALFVCWVAISSHRLIRFGFFCKVLLDELGGIALRWDLKRIT